MSRRQRSVAAQIISSYEMNNHVRYNECAVEGALKCRTDKGNAPIDPATLMDLFKSDKERAYARLAELTSAERINQAIETATYLEEQGKVLRWIDILNKWNAKVAA